MGWSIGTGQNGRDIGYGVPALCDHPKCDVKIDRGISYLCGGLSWGEYGCGLYFCDKHMPGYRKPRGSDDEVQQCTRCYNYRPPFEPKEDIQEWIDWKLTDESWAKWREQHPEFVKKYKK